MTTYLRGLHIESIIELCTGITGITGGTQHTQQRLQEADEEEVECTRAIM